MAYQFTTRHPPLLRDGEDIIALTQQHPEVLRSQVGSPAAWSKHYAMEGQGPLHAFRKYFENEYTAIRVFSWHIVEGPERIAASRRTTIRTTTGYSEERKHSVSQMLEVDVNASLMDMFDASVKASLHIDDSLTQTWRTERVEETTEEWKAGETYVTWALVDSIIIKRSQTTWLYHDDGNKTTTFDSQSLDCNRFIFGDTTEGTKPTRIVRRSPNLVTPVTAVHEIKNASFSSFLEHTKSPCTKCDCEDFVDVSMNSFCDNRGCGHGFEDHL